MTLFKGKLNEKIKTKLSDDNISNYSKVSEMFLLAFI